MVVKMRNTRIMYATMCRVLSERPAPRTASGMGIWARMKNVGQ